jgi:hypothetical protein
MRTPEIRPARDAHGINKASKTGIRSFIDRCTNAPPATNGDLWRRQAGEAVTTLNRDRFAINPSVNLQHMVVVVLMLRNWLRTVTISSATGAGNSYTGPSEPEQFGRSL